MQVENLGKLERRLSLSVPLAEIEREVDLRLKRLSRSVRMAGFRPGKVPMKIVAQQYGYKVHNEVLKEKVGGAFSKAVEENQLRVAGAPNIVARNADTPEPASADKAVAFDAIFEIYPEVKIGALESAKVERATTEVDDVAVDKTIAILRRQRTHFHSTQHGDADTPGHAAPAGRGEATQPGDRVTIDFKGTIDGVAFEGGSAENFVFVIGEKRMLPEFESAVTGLAPGQEKEFELTFPADYQGREMAGKTARFSVVLKGVEWAHVPAIDAEFAKSLGVPDGDLGKMRLDIRANLEREVQKRLKARTKESVMNALLAASDLDVPKTLLDAEVDRLSGNARTEMRQRGMTVDAGPLPAELFAAQAERRVRLGLLLAELVRINHLQATPEQIKAHIEELARSYERPSEVVRWYFGDRARLGEVEALVLEENVVNFVLGKAQVSERAIAFDELMGENAGRGT